MYSYKQARFVYYTVDVKLVKLFLILTVDRWKVNGSRISSHYNIEPTDGGQVNIAQSYLINRYAS